MTTIIDVSTETQLDAAIAEANAGASGSSFEIVLQADIAENYVLAGAVDLPSGVTLSISDGTNTLVGPYALAPAIAIDTGSTLTAAGTVPTDEMIMFAGIPGATNAVLDIAAPTQFSGTIEGFASGDELAISSTITGATPGSYNSANNTTSLSLTNGGTTVAILNLEGDYSAATFQVSADNITATLPSVTATLPSGSVVFGTKEVAAGATTTQTGQITFGSSGDPATVINQGTYAITGAWGISAGNANALLINDGTLERAANTANGLSYIDVNVIDTGTIIVPDNNPNGNNTNLRFDGANNSFSGIYIGGGMIDYGNPDDVGSGTDALGDLDMQNGACTTSWAIVNQNGQLELSYASSITNYGTWNFTSNNGWSIEAPGDTGSSFSNYGTLAKTGGTGTTVLDVSYFNPFAAPVGAIIIDSGTLAFNGLQGWFYSSISGAGIFSLGGGSADAINSGTSITSSGWTITDAGTNVALNESLTYSGTFTDQSGANLTLASGVTLALANLTGSGGSITFDTDSELKFGGHAQSLFADTIDGFAPGDMIDLTSIANVAGSHANMNYTTNVLTITEGSNTYTLNFSPTQNFVGDYFHLTPDNSGAGPGTDITENTTPCYCRGTLIRTECGEVPVEALTIGSRVLTKSGEGRSIKWIGRRSYGGRFIMGRKDVLPICIKAGALDDGVPQRDLWLSPHHALYIDGLLIEAKDLVNGVSIVQAEYVEKVEYFHIELENHDVIFAEGALAESFIDDDSRGMFNNLHEYRRLYGDVAPGLAQFCAPRREEGYPVEAVRQHIARRAGVGAKKDKPHLGGLHGFIDRVSANTVEGWAQNIEHPEAPVCLDIYASGRLVGHVLANRYREDLAQARLGSGRHGFVFTLPRELTINSVEVEVRRSLDATALPNARFPRTAGSRA